MNSPEEPLFEEFIYDLNGLSDREVRSVLQMALQHMNLGLYLTNKNKHRVTELQLRTET